MQEQAPSRYSKQQKIIMAVIFLSAVTGIVIGLMRKKGLDSSALLYIGIPTMIALVFSTTSPANSAVGVTLKALTFIILISGPLLQEGFVCMIMAAPIFYIVGALAAWPFDHYRKKKQRDEDASKLNMFVVPGLLLVMSMEGVIDATTFERHNNIVKTQLVEASVEQVRIKLAQNRSVPVPDSLFARIFPRPDTINAQGVAVGDRHWIEVTYAKWVFWNKKSGASYFEVVESQPGLIRFRPVQDNSYMKSYLDWGETVVTLQPVSANMTKVSWEIHFTRKLDPAWYVQPLQRYAVGVLANTLIASIK